jgi:hypothetical protein
MGRAAAVFRPAPHVDRLPRGRRAKATVHDLARLLTSLRKTLGAKHPRSYNLARSAALGFLRDTVKRSHGLYAAVRDVSPCKVPKHARCRPDWMRNHPLRRTPTRSTRSQRHVDDRYGRWRVLGMLGVARRSEPQLRNEARRRVREVRSLVRRRRRGSITERSKTNVRECTNRAIEPYDLRRCFSR